MTKTPREILIGSDSDNMCLTCAIGILNNPSEEFKSNFEMDCRRGGLAFEEISTGNNNVLYFFMNIALDDAKKFFESYKLKTCIFIQKLLQTWKIQILLNGLFKKMIISVVKLQSIGKTGFHHLYRSVSKKNMRILLTAGGRSILKIMKME